MSRCMCPFMWAPSIAAGYVSTVVERGRKEKGGHTIGRIKPCMKQLTSSFKTLERNPDDIQHKAIMNMFVDCKTAFLLVQPTSLSPRFILVVLSNCGLDCNEG